MIKYILMLALLACVSACSDRPKSFQGVHHPAPKSVSALVGQTRNEIHARYGKPQATRVEDGQALWTYRKETCSTLIYFNEKGTVKHAETRGVCKTQGIAENEK